MRTTTKTLFGLVLVAGAALLLLRGCGQESAPPAVGPQVAANAAHGAEVATGAASGTAREAAPQRDAVSAAAASSAAWLDHPFTFELDVLVVDPLGLPVQGHSLRLSVPHSTMNDAPVASGPDGRLSMRWPSRVASGSVVLVDSHDTRRTIAVQHGSKTRVTLLGARSGGGPELVISFTQEGNGPTLALAHGIKFVRDFAAPAAGTEPGAPSGLHPYVVFDTRAAVAKVEPPQVVEALSVSEIAFDSNQWVSRVGLGGSLRVINTSRAASATDAAETPAAVRIGGTVFGDDGKPVAKLPVVLLGQGPQPVQQVETDDAGQFVFEGLAAAEFTVRAGGTEAGLATVPAVTTVGTTSVVLNLQRGSCVCGKALRADGTPLAKAAVSWRANDGTWCDETTTHDDGSFAFANLPGSAGTVLLWAPDDGSPLPIASAANVLCDSGELVLRAAAEAGSAMRIEPVFPEGLDGAVSVRLWNLDLGLGKPVPGPEAGKPYEFDKLAAGWYRVELHHAATGWIDAGRFWLDGKANAELGRVLLPAPARVKIEVDPALLPAKDQQRAEVCSLRPDVDVRLAGVGAAETLLLPAGDYVFAWRGADGAVHFHRFAAVAGRELTVRPMY